MTRKAQPTMRPDPDLVTRAKLLRSLKGELVRPPSMERITKWISQAVNDRTKFMTDTVWGIIRWEKSVGRSLGPTLASGFRIEHWYLEMNWAVRADGTPKDLSKWVRGAEPSAWDMPDDAGHHQVGYMFRAQRPWVNEVIVRFSDTTPWDSPLYVRLRSTHRAIVPPEQYFTMGEANHAVLDETRIVEVRVRAFG